MAAQSVASAHSADASFQAAEEAIESYGRAKAAGNAEQRKKKDVLIENRQLHEENQKLLVEKQKLQAENCILNVGKKFFMKRT